MFSRGAQSVRRSGNNHRMNLSAHARRVHRYRTRPACSSGGCFHCVPECAGGHESSANRAVQATFDDSFGLSNDTAHEIADAGYISDQALALTCPEKTAIQVSALEQLAAGDTTHQMRNIGEGRVRTLEYRDHLIRH